MRKTAVNNDSDDESINNKQDIRVDTFENDMEPSEANHRIRKSMETGELRESVSGSQENPSFLNNTMDAYSKGLHV